MKMDEAIRQSFGGANASATLQTARRHRWMAGLFAALAVFAGAAYFI